MAKYRIKPKTPALSGMMPADMDVDGVKKALASMVLMYQAIKKQRGKKGALGK